jgi:polygalacturonase
VKNGKRGERMIYYNIQHYGAKGDGKTDNTHFISETIKACEQNGGGTVFIPAGEYVTGPIQLISNMTLYLESGAIVKFKDDFDCYGPVKTRWSGYECYAFSPLLFGRNLENVAIKGEGCLDGQGKAWWDVHCELRHGDTFASDRTREIAELNKVIKEQVITNIVEWESQFLRPPLLQLIHCKNVTIEGITLQHSPFWNTHLVYCENVRVHGVTFKNPYDAPNSDGLDIDSCSNVRVSDCTFDVGDDCLVLKSGINEDGRRIGQPTENVVITNCTMIHGHGGFVLGSENSGGIKNITISNCIFSGTDRGIRIKTNRERGSYIKNVLVNNIYIENVLCPISINAFYRYGISENDLFINCEEAIPVTEKTPRVEHIQISHVTAKNCRAAAIFIYGLPEMPIQDVSLRHITIEMTEDPNELGGEPDMVKEPIIMAGEGAYCKFAREIEFHHVKITTRQGPAITIQNCEEVDIQHLKMKKTYEHTPDIVVNNSKNIFVNGKEANGSFH